MDSSFFCFNIVRSVNCTQTLFIVLYHIIDIKHRYSPFETVKISRISTLRENNKYARADGKNTVDVYDIGDILISPNNENNNPSATQNTRRNKRKTQDSTIAEHESNVNPLYIWEGPSIPFDNNALSPSLRKYFNNLSTVNRSLFLKRFRNHTLERSPVNFEDYKKKKVYLFVVNFHFDFYSNIPFLESEFFPTFAEYFDSDFDVVMIGPDFNRNYTVISADIPRGGYYSYHSVTVALNCFPRQAGFDYAGVMLMNDDSCIHPVFLNKHNISNTSIFESSSHWGPNIGWMWNNMRNQHSVLFKDAFVNAMKELNTIPAIQQLCELNETKLYKGWSDFFYVTKKDIPNFLLMEQVFFKHRVFLENAVPTTMMCLKAEKIINCNHGSMPKIKQCLHVHPMKFSKTINREMCMNRIRSINLSAKPKTLYYHVCLNPRKLTAEEFHYFKTG